MGVPISQTRSQTDFPVNYEQKDPMIVSTRGVACHKMICEQLARTSYSRSGCNKLSQSSSRSNITCFQRNRPEKPSLGPTATWYLSNRPGYTSQIRQQHGTSAIGRNSSQVRQQHGTSAIGRDTSLGQTATWYLGNRPQIQILGQTAVWHLNSVSSCHMVHQQYARDIKLSSSRMFQGTSQNRHCRKISGLVRMKTCI